MAWELWRIKAPDQPANFTHQKLTLRNSLLEATLFTNRFTNVFFRECIFLTARKGIFNLSNVGHGVVWLLVKLFTETVTPGG